MKRSKGPTTVGPETTRMMPSITAAPRDMPSSGAATAAASTQVIRTPRMVRAPCPPQRAAQVQAQARVVQDDRHRQGHQRLERGPEQLVRIDVGSQGARDETDRQQHDDGRDAQPAGQYLGAHGEHENQAHTDQDLASGHPSLR